MALQEPNPNWITYFEEYSKWLFKKQLDPSGSGMYNITDQENDEKKKLINLHLLLHGKDKFTCVSKSDTIANWEATSAACSDDIIINKINEINNDDLSKKEMMKTFGFDVDNPDYSLYKMFNKEKKGCSEGQDYNAENNACQDEREAKYKPIVREIAERYLSQKYLAAGKDYSKSVIPPSSGGRRRRSKKSRKGGRKSRRSRKGGRKSRRTRRGGSRRRSRQNQRQSRRQSRRRRNRQNSRRQRQNQRQRQRRRQQQQH